MCIKIDLTECLIRCRKGIFLLHPGSLTVSGDYRDLVGIAGCQDDPGILADGGLLIQSLYEGILILIRNKIAAFGIDTFLEGIDDFLVGIFGADAVPKCVAVGICCSAFLLVRLCITGSGGEGSVYRFLKLCLPFLEALHPLDVPVEILKVVLHLRIGGIILSGETDVIYGSFLQEIPGLLHEGGSFRPEFLKSLHLDSSFELSF